MASTGEVWKLGHRPALDGVRGIAILLVVASHASGVTLVGAGVMGVTCFFTLSGFLITALLLEEHANTGTIRLPAFYMRRARRLLPALVAFLVVMLAAGFAVHPTFSEPQDTAAALFYVGNWVMATGVGHLGGIRHTWSLSVEEQFYLLWPLIVVVCLRRGSPRTLARLAAGGILVAVALRALLWDDGRGEARIYFGTDTRADGLLVGCLLAIWMHQRRADNRARPELLATAGAGAVLSLALNGGANDYLLLPALVPAVTALAIWAATQGTYRGWLESRWLVTVGRRSYGLYLWHYPLVVTVAGALPWSRWATEPILLAAAWGMTVLSWRFVESPFLRMKAKRYTPSSQESTVTPAP